MITRRQFVKAGLAASACALAYGGLPIVASPAKKKLNVLFIAVDDLRPQLGCYGVKDIRTPNIDALAGRGVVFDRAYCQQAVCSPSRTSLLTGCRPDTTRVYDLQTHFRKNIPNVVTLPEYFKQQGYRTQGLSKIYHPGLDDPQSWSVPHWDPKPPAYYEPNLRPTGRQSQPTKPIDEDKSDSVIERDPRTGLPLKIKAPSMKKGLPWKIVDGPDNSLPDGMTADKAIEVLGEIKDKPFFLAVGFLKPHLPFVAPKKYYDLYPLDKITLADNPYPPKDCPPYALAHWGELRAYKGMPKKGDMPDKEARELRRGYYAAASYTDAQIGRVIGELDRLGLRENTVIVLWGDHGWQLGEHSEWCKHTNFEVATRAPLIISAPGQKAGVKTEALVEFVDIYPTLCDLCGLPLPKQLEGTSLEPVLADPKRGWKIATFSQFPRPGGIMGHSIRTDRYRYTEWAQTGKEPAARELYDHKLDPEENANIANLPESKALVAELARKLHAGWRAAVPGKAGLVSSLLSRTGTPR